MVANKFNISIPEPCHQKWDDMSPATGGRHCYNCAKTVVDFTTMSDQQIVNYLAKSAYACGRIGQEQIDRVNSKKVNKRSSLNIKAFFVAACLSIAPLTKTFAQHRSKTKIQINKAKPVKIECYRSISGRVIDSADRTSLPGAVISVKGRNVFTVADLTGRFSINVPESADTLLVKFSSYQDQKVKMGSDIEYLDIAVTARFKANVVGRYVTQTRTAIVGAVVVIKQEDFYAPPAPFYKRWYYRFIARPVKKVFG